MPRKYLEVAFRYALSQPGVASAAIGMATAAELKQNAAWAKNFKPLMPWEIAQLRSIGKDLSKDWGPHLGPIV